MSSVQHDLTNIESLIHESRDEANNDELRMSDAERGTLARCRDLLKREPLVQAIVDFHKEIMWSARSWTLEEKAQGGKRMADLVTKLAEWKP